MNTFEKTADHPLVSLLEEKMKEVNYSQIQKEIFQKLPKDFDAESPSLFSTPGEDYLEWIDVIEAVSSAKSRFVMFELGAGYGRWCVNAMIALKFLNPIPFRFVAVEAENTHFRFLKDYFIAHELDLKDHSLIKAAINSSEGHALFHMGDPNEWYGQCIDHTQVGLLGRSISAIKNLLQIEKKTRRKEFVKTITLNSLLADTEKVDLIDMDIQGSELDVLNASIDLLNQKVKRLHIGTHSQEIDEGLKKLFLQHQWENIHLFPLMTSSETPYGIINFNDGVQSWINPRIN